MKELIIDSFAGGGGASTGIELATGRYVDIAINHDEAAILMHKTNHPHTQHYQDDIWEVDPKKATKGQPVGLMWASPDCTHHSRAKGGKPVEKAIRGLAWVVVKWARVVRPRVIILENVPEFQEWGPLIDNQPDPGRKGETFGQFVKALKKYGYKVEWRELRACDYGAPTIRKRLFLIARCDGQPIRWPEPTHGDPGTLEVVSGLLKPWNPISEHIDWTDLGGSIFTRKTPLKEKTLNRIARGIDKFIINDPNRFILPHEAASSFLIQYHSETKSDYVRGQSVNEPIKTIDTSNRYGLVTAFLTKFYKTGTGQSANDPIHTITTSPGHFGLVSAFLIKYYGQGNGQSVNAPIGTVVTKDRFGLVSVMIKGEPYQIVDIWFRMLKPEELKLGQGFPADYIIDHDYTGKPYPKTQQVARIGNSVVPTMSEVLVEVNLPELCEKKGEETG